MSKVLRTVATIAASVALIATGVGAAAGAAGIAGVASGATLSTIATVASLTAGVAGAASSLTAPKPIARGSPAQVVIAAEPPRPYIVGQVMTGGVLRHDVGYGATRNKVPNPFRWQVRVLSAGGGIQGIVGEFFDFAPINNGYFGGFFNSTQNLGQRPQAAALVPPYGPAPGWDASSKISGSAHVGLNFLFDKDGKRFASGLPIYTALCDGEKAYDPRQDSTFPGGSGPCRLGDESTYVYSGGNPAIEAAMYAYGRFENGKRIFGLGQPADTIDWPAVVDWANDCDANGWRANIILQEGGTDANLREQRVRNLDDLCAAGGGRWYQAGGLLSFDWHRPRIALATLTDADILQAGGGTDAVPTVRERMNGVRPQYVSPQHNWQMITAAEIVGSTYRAEDGQPLTQVYPLNGVTNVEQAGELASYAMADSRELGPMDVQAVARWRFYRPGDCIQVNSSLIAYQGQAVINQRSLDPETFAVSLSLKSETPGKHDFALGKVADPPPTPILAQTPEERDLLVAANITPRAVDVEYDDGETVEGMKPAEPGATEGARLPSPGAAGGGAVGNIKDHTGRIYNPGELLNTSIRLTPSGRLEYRPLPDVPWISLGLINLPDLGAASAIAIRRAEDDIDQLGRALATALDEASRTRATFTDAGFYSDPATGQVRIHAIEQTRERVSRAEIRLNAAEASINLKASVSYVDEQLALAVFDPSQIADLETVFFRLTEAEADISGLDARISLLASASELSLVAGRVTTAESVIDALEGVVSTKVDTTTFNALETRVTGAESTLTAIGDTAQIVNAVRSVRLVERDQDANAEADLRALLQGDRTQREQVAAIASARQELRTDITEGLAAEASARQFLQVRLGQAEASIATESLARATGDNALASQITQLAATTNSSVASLNASITAESAARTSAVGALTTSVSNLTASLTTTNNNLSAETAARNAALQAEANTRIAALNAEAAARVAAVQAEATARGQALTTEQQARIAAINAEAAARADAIAAEAAARQQAVTTLTASINSESQARVSADNALAAQVNTVSVALTTETSNRQAALTAEQQARQNAINAEADARVAAIQAEATARGQALSAEQQARINAINAERQQTLADVAAEAQARQAAVSSLAASVQTEQQARIDGDALIAAGLAQQVTAGRVTDGRAADLADQLLGALLRGDSTRREVNGALAGVRQEITAQIVADKEAFASSLTALVARVAGNEASIITEQQARTTAIQSLAQSITTLNASFTTQIAAETSARNTAIGNLANAFGEDLLDERGNRIAGDAAEAAARAAAVTTLTASINNEATARANADGALASQISALTVTVGNNSAAITAANQARIDGDQVLAGQINTLTTTVNGNTASINQFAESINGLRNRVGLRLDNNGRVTGWVLNSSTTESDFTLVIDKFRIFAPGMTVARAPFEFDATAGKLRLAADVEIDGDLNVKNGTLSAEKFVADGITRAYQAGNPSAITLDAIEDVVTITIEMEQPGTIILIADMQFVRSTGSSWDFELAVGSTVLKTGSGNLDGYASFSGVFFAPSAGTYVAKARAAGFGGVTINPGGAGLVALRTYT